jgi:hypothetical protein
VRRNASIAWATSQTFSRPNRQSLLFQKGHQNRDQQKKRSHDKALIASEQRGRTLPIPVNASQVKTSMPVPGRRQNDREQREASPAESNARDVDRQESFAREKRQQRKQT